MGSFFGAELCDLIGLYALNHLKSLYKDHEIGLYRDGGLVIIEQKNNQILENTKKRTIKLLNEIGFKIIIDIGATTCNFLDTTLNLNDDEYEPYRKDNSDVKHINNKSNHPIIIEKSSQKWSKKELTDSLKMKRYLKALYPHNKML